MSGSRVQKVTLILPSASIWPTSGEKVTKTLCSLPSTSVSYLEPQVNDNLFPRQFFRGFLSRSINSSSTRVEGRGNLPVLIDNSRWIGGFLQVVSDNK